MSRFLTVKLALDVESFCEGMQALNLPVETARPGRQLMLGSGAACIPVPVDLRCPAGTADTIEAWGVRVTSGILELVCGEFDRAHLEEKWIPKIRRAALERRIEHAAAIENIDIEVSASVDEHLTVGNSRRYK